MSATFGDQPGDVVTSSRGDVLNGVSLSLYPTSADAAASTNLLTTVATNTLGRWAYTHATLTVVWVRTLDGQVYAVEDPTATVASAVATAGTNADTKIVTERGTERAYQSNTYLPGVALVGAGIDPTGVAFSTAAIQAKMDSLSTFGGGVANAAAGTFKHTGLLMPSNVTLQGPGSGAQGGAGGAACRFTYAGAAGGTVIGPKNRTIDTINVGIKGIYVDGGGLAALGIDMYRTSYSRLQDCLVGGMQAGGVGVLFDANDGNQCYFNTADGMKVDGVATGVTFARGANANRWAGGKIGNGGTGMEFLSLSAGNLVTGTDFESASVKHIYVDAPTNVFVGLHMETAPIGYDITANGNQTRRFGTTFASSVTTYVADASATANSLDSLSLTADKLQIGSTRIVSTSLTGSTTVNIDPAPATGTANVILNWFRNVTTTGLRQFNIYKGDGTNNSAAMLDVATGNLSLGGKLGLGGYGTVEMWAGAPSTGPYAVGSLAFDRLPVAGEQMGWVCTVAGTPGTWVPLPPIIARTGLATLVAGTVTVADAAITANSIIRVASKTLGGTPGALFVSAKTAATNFTITSTNAADTSVVQYEIIAY